MFLISGVIHFPLYITISQKASWIIASAEYVHCAERKFHQKKMKLLFFFWVMNNVCQTSTPIWFCLSDIFWDLTLKPFAFCFDFFGGGSKEKENRTLLQVAKIELL